MIDIDHFKRINDSYGHAFGDQVLRAVAQVLKALTPEGGLAARVGGEEFALLLARQDAGPGGRRWPRSCAPPWRPAASAARAASSDERITVSLGVAQFLQQNPALGLAVDEAPADFVDRADRALYAAKQAGRDRVVVA